MLSGKRAHHVFVVLSTIEQVPVARRETAKTLALWGVDPETAFTAGLIVTELVANVAEHASAESPTATVALAADVSWLTLAVHDSHPRLPRALATPYDDGGRGLRMVMLLTEEAGGRHTVEPTAGGGKHIVVHLPLPFGPPLPDFQEIARQRPFTG
ncbi:ATP-binding protein [Sphaerisporangium perillae]|uniref:ATP-binding protein n=1 Tax=Sphaerisporangium perillae TaxID=2935860 RepID=UPI00200F3D80|nr:ATP-binding protein [Sphaerisporangium perillae]